MRKKEYIDRPKICDSELGLNLYEDGIFKIDMNAEDSNFYEKPTEIYKYGDQKLKVVGKKVTDYSYQTKNSHYWFMWLGRKRRIEIL